MVRVRPGSLIYRQIKSLYCSGYLLVYYIFKVMILLIAVLLSVMLIISVISEVETTRYRTVLEAIHFRGDRPWQLGGFYYFDMYL